MTKKKKDFFESVLSDVRPLNKKKHIVFKHDESTNKPKIKHKKVEYIKKTIAVEEKRPTNQNQLSHVINDKSNFFKKLKRGRVGIDRKIDLHGLTLIQAEKTFDAEIENSFNKKLRCILFITGKGLRKKDQEEFSALYYGKIRNDIGKWVKKKQNEEKILYFSVAHISHGGDGSFYVYLRKK